MTSFTQQGDGPPVPGRHSQLLGLLVLEVVADSSVAQHGWNTPLQIAVHLLESLTSSDIPACHTRRTMNQHGRDPVTAQRTERHMASGNRQCGELPRKTFPKSGVFENEGSPVVSKRSAPQRT